MVAGCANREYAGINYGTYTNGPEQWKLAGGKDESNVSLEVHKADGTYVIYKAEKADGSQAMASLLQAQQQQTAQLLAVLGPLAQQAIKLAPVAP